MKHNGTRLLALNIKKVAEQLTARGQPTRAGKNAILPMEIG